MNETKNRFSTKVLAEIIVFSALSAALYIIRPFQMPYGGAVTLGSMVPVMWLSMRRGVYAGIIAGTLFGIMALPIDVMLLPYSPIATPIQAVLEYPVAFGVLGLVGVFHKRKIAFAIAGVAFSVFIKFLIHYFVGVFIWYYVYEFPAFGQYIYPAVYNGLFLVPEFIISAIIIIILMRRGTLEYGL
ncbi:MAG: energy-coupled thiamine transporter ThiT [Candidatus Bathyarchaeia archaeon]